MNQASSTTPTRHAEACPTGTVHLELALGTIEELEYLAELLHIERDQLITQLINIALIDDTLCQLVEESASGPVVEHQRQNRARSFELLHGSAER